MPATIVFINTSYPLLHSPLETALPRKPVGSTDYRQRDLQWPIKCSCATKALTISSISPLAGKPGYALFVETNWPILYVPLVSLEKAIFVTSVQLTMVYHVLSPL